MTTPTPRQTPDKWGADNRVYEPSSGVPGKRNPALTPYVIPVGEAIATGEWSRVVWSMFAQGGKSETFLDVMGERMDNAPAPILYTGPSKQFLTEQWDPRMEALLATKALRGKVSARRMTKTRKVISGLPIRLAHAGSSTALKSDPFALALTDEADELMANVKGQGDPIGLIDRRGDTYADFTHAIVSTPSRGACEVERDPESGLEFWSVQPPEDIDSKIWSLWQEGTRYHWAWPCPQCGAYFIPRFSCLEVSGKDWRKVTDAQARRDVRMICPRNGCVIGHADPKVTAETIAEMNARGVYVAPGQRVTKAGRVIGSPPESSTISFWVSGLASPFKTWNERAEAYVKALQSGDQQTVQTVINSGFGELWSPVGGEVPEWEEVRKCAIPYREGELPAGVVWWTMGVDVQKNRLVYTGRGWGAKLESWLLMRGVLYGDTSQDGVWADLAELIEAPIAGMHVKRVFIDAGFRPGKKDVIPEHKVYEFCRNHSRLCYATKGFDTRPTPLSVNRIDVNVRGRKAKVGLDLVRLHTDFFKSWVHERVRWPEGVPGGWHLFETIDEDYCRQIVSEARIKKPSGGYTWIERSRNNHYLDTEALTYAGAYMLGVHRLDRKLQRRAGRADADDVPPDAGAAPAHPEHAPPTTARQRPARRAVQSSYM